LAIREFPFDYQVKVLTKDAAHKLESMGINRLTKRSFKSLAEAELSRFKRPDGTVDTFGIDFDRPVSAETSNNRSSGKAGGTEPFITTQLKKISAVLIIQSTWRMYRSRLRMRGALDNPAWSNENTDQEELLSVYSTGSNRLPLAIEYMFSVREKGSYKHSEPNILISMFVY
jgi:hypothetical protein